MHPSATTLLRMHRLSIPRTDSFPSQSSQSSSLVTTAWTLYLFAFHIPTTFACIRTFRTSVVYRWPVLVDPSQTDGTRTLNGLFTGPVLDPLRHRTGPRAWSFLCYLNLSFRSDKLDFAVLQVARLRGLHSIEKNMPKGFSILCKPLNRATCKTAKSNLSDRNERFK